MWPNSIIVMYVFPGKFEFAQRPVNQQYEGQGQVLHQHPPGGNVQPHNQPVHDILPLPHDGIGQGLELDADLGLAKPRMEHVGIEEARMAGFGNVELKQVDLNDMQPFGHKIPALHREQLPQQALRRLLDHDTAWHSRRLLVEKYLAGMSLT